jgi:hypothetical protein
MFHQSEDKRGELHIHIEQTTVKFHQESEEHVSYQSELIAEIDSLKTQIQQLKSIHAKKEQENYKNMDQLNQAHANEIQQINDQHNT